MKKFFLLLLLFLPCYLYGQENQSHSVDSLKSEIIKMKADVDNIKLNLGRVENRFKTGIFVSTLGYSIVITGGLMLGRKNDDLGKVLLVTGGVTGVTGTIMMVDAFKFLGIASGKKKESPDNAAQIYGTSEKMEQMKKRNPMRKVGKGVDIENVVSFVIGRLFFWITGQVLAVDGRMSTQKI